MATKTERAIGACNRQATCSANSHYGDCKSMPSAPSDDFRRGLRRAAEIAAAHNTQHEHDAEYKNCALAIAAEIETEAARADS